MRVPAALALALALAPGCGSDRGQSGAGLAQTQRARGQIVARVDGAPIGLDDVRELCQRTGLAPRLALARLEEERLLYQEAVRRGYLLRSGALEREARRVAVQALLARTVEQVRPETIPLSTVRERFNLVAAQRKLSPETFAQHEPAVREQLASEQRKAALDQLLAKARAAFSVQLSEQQAQRLLRDPSLWGGSS